MPPNEAATVPTEAAIPYGFRSPQTHTIRAPLRSILRQPAFPRKRRSRLRVQRSLEMLRRLRATDLPNEVVLIGPTKCASSGAASTRTALSQQRVLRPANTEEVSSSSWHLTMRLSDAGLRCRQSKLLYPDHRSPPWPIVDAPRDRSNRLLDDTQRSRDRAHRSCNSLRLLQHHTPQPIAPRFAQLYGNLRLPGNADPDCKFNVDLECSTDSAQPLRKTKWS
jgi:hypothetical protein